MNELQIFNNAEFGEIRTVTVNNQPYFVGKDVAEALGYERADNAIRNHIDEEDKLTHQISASGQGRNMILINESGLYSLVLSSKLPTAKKFKRWVTSEVLPAIRRNGGYIAGQENMSDSEIMAKALLVAQRTIESKQSMIVEMTPKAIFADAVASSKHTILIGELAKLLKQNGVDTGEKRLFCWMRDNGFLIKRRGSDYNSPTQKSMDLGLLEVKETAITHSDGHVTVNKTTKVTGKGQQYFINKFLGAAEKAS